jgi:hypothetical protein
MVAFVSACSQGLGVDDLCKMFVNVAIDGYDSKSGDITGNVLSHSGKRCYSDW